MIIGGLTKEDLELNAKSFIEHINAQGVPKLGVMVVFFDRGDLTPFTATNVTPHEARVVAQKVMGQANHTVLPVDGKLVS